MITMSTTAAEAVEALVARLRSEMMNLAQQNDRLRAAVKRGGAREIELRERVRHLEAERDELINRLNEALAVSPGVL